MNIGLDIAVAKPVWRKSLLSTVSSPNHLACSWASTWHPTQATGAE
jgi:hypothetical protein